MVEGPVAGEGSAVDASVVKADANRQRGVPGERSVDWSESEQARRPIREYLDSLDACEPRKAPKKLSLTDPLAQWTAASGGPAFYAYSTNYLVDIEAGIIVDVEATPAHRSQEVNATKTMVERFELYGKMRRSVHEPARDVVRRLRDTPEYRQSRCDRKKVEILFGHLKRILKLDRLRLRRMTGATDEFLFTATAQNLRRLALWLGHGPPEGRKSASVY